VTLLRFLQDHEYRPVGSSTIARADVRILAATNVDLRSLVHKGAYRLDLFFRLNVLSLRLPSLRNRPGDATLLAQNLIDRLNQQWGEPGKVLHPVSIALLESHSWPGNVRELENLIQREFILATDRVIRISSIDQDDNEAEAHGAGNPPVNMTFKAAKALAVARFEKGYLVALLARTSGNLSLASRLSGKDRSDISRLVRKHGLSPQSFLASVNRL
jgi:DNA-binding NtrC family response regulator